MDSSSMHTIVELERELRREGGKLLARVKYVSAAGRVGMLMLTLVMWH